MLKKTINLLEMKMVLVQPRQNMDKNRKKKQNKVFFKIRQFCFHLFKMG